MRILLFTLLATSTSLLMSSPHIRTSNSTYLVKQKANEDKANAPVPAGNGTNKNTAPQKQSWPEFVINQVSLAASGGLAGGTIILYIWGFPYFAATAAVVAVTTGITGYQQVSSSTDSLQQKLLKTIPSLGVGAILTWIGRPKDQKEQ
jgi:hypothetical protein